MTFPRTRPYWSKAAALCDLWLASFAILFGLASRAWSAAELRRANPIGAVQVAWIGGALVVVGVTAFVAGLFVLTGRRGGWVVLFPFNAGVTLYGAMLTQANLSLGLAVAAAGLILSWASFRPPSRASQVAS